YRRVKVEYGPIVNEADWLSCTRTWKLISYTRARTTARTQRLLACACCRQVWNEVNREGRLAIETAERFAEGQAKASEWATAREAVEATLAARGAWSRRVQICRMVTGACSPNVSHMGVPEGLQGMELRLARDVLGNPFRPIVVDPAWLAW